MAQQSANIPKETYTRILDTVFASLKQRGFKATTMDSIASQLSMSKRTLYEIFENKDQMFVETLKHSHRQMRATITRIFTQSSNVIEAIIKTFRLHQLEMNQTNPVFFRDMDDYAKKMREIHDAEHNQDAQTGIMNVINLGVQQDVFRDDIDYRITLRFLQIQMESLKRTEVSFPKDVTLSEIYATLGVNFLRSIATSKGLALIEDYLKMENLNNPINETN